MDFYGSKGGLHPPIKSQLSYLKLWELHRIETFSKFKLMLDVLIAGSGLLGLTLLTQAGHRDR